MHRLLFFWFLLLCNVGFSQIQIFEDYKLCLMGIKNRQGEVLYEAQFQKITRHLISSTNSSEEYYLLDTDEFLGLIDNKGKLILPWEYTDIQLLSDSSFVASKDGEAYFIEYSKGLERPLGFERVHALTRYNKDRYSGNVEVLDQPLYLLGWNNERCYLLDSNFRQISDTGYDQISLRLYEIGWPKIVASNLYFKTILGKKNGILDHDGNVVVPCEYLHAEALLVRNSEGTTTPYYSALDSLRNMGMFNAKGALVIPMKHSLVRGERTFENSAHSITDQHYPIFIAQDAKTKQLDLYHLNSGKTLKGFQDAMMFGSHVVFQDSEGWGIIDSNLNVVSSGNKKVHSFFCGPFQGFPDEFGGHYSYYQEIDNSAVIPPNYNVIYVCQPFQEKTYFQNGRKYTQLNRDVKRGLLNFKTGNRIPIKYASIAIKKTPHAICFWAVYPRKNEKSPFKVDVYDSAFVKLRTIELDAMDEDDYYAWRNELENLTEVEEMTPFHQFRIDGRAGVLNYLGETVIPFEHDKMKSLSFQKEWHIKFIRPDFLLASNNEKWNLYYPDGKRALAASFEEIQILDSCLLAKREDFYSLFDASLNLIQNSISAHIVLPALNENGREIRGKNRSIVHRSYLIIDAYLYEWTGAEIILIDENRIPFSGSSKILFKRFLVARNGKIMENYTRDNAGMRAFRGGFGKFRLNGDNLTIYGNGGNKYHEFHNVLNQKQCGSILRVQTKTTHFVYDLQTFKVLHSSNRSRATFAMTDTRNQKQLFWMRDNKSNSYDLYNLGGIKVDSNFRYFTAKTKTVTQKGDKFGLIDENGQTLIPHEYDHIGFENDIYYLKKGALWSIYQYASDSMHPQSFSDISTNRHFSYRMQPRYLVQSGNRFGVVDLNYETLVPFSSEDSLLKHTDLFQLFFEGSRAKGFGGFESKGMDPLYRQLSNENILRKLKSTMASNRMFLFSNCPPPNDMNCYSSKDQKTFANNEFETKLDIKVSFAQNGVYSVQETKSTFHIVEREKVLESYAATYGNYRIQKGRKTTFMLQDLFANPETYHDDIKNILLETFNEQQSFGLQCVNIDPVVVSANTQFSIEPAGIRVYDGAISRGVVLISKNRILPYLKNKRLFD